MILRPRGVTFENRENSAIRLPHESCLRLAWMCSPWACRMISKWRLKKGRHVCGWGLRFSGKEPRLNHRGHRGTQRKCSRFISLAATDVPYVRNSVELRDSLLQRPYGN